MIRNAMGVGGSVRKKSSRWGSSSSSMDEEIRRLAEEEEEEDFDKNNSTNAMWEEQVLEKMRNAMRVERVRAISRFELMGVTDEEIRNAMELEISRLKEEDEIRTNRYLMEIEVEKIRNTSSKFVLHISPLEIIDNPCDQDFINVVVAENINQIELVIIIIDHHSIHQYWTPRRSTTTSSSSCQHHDDYLHPRDDDDDEEMILAACRPLLDSPRRLKIILDRGVFAESDDDDDEQHIIMSTAATQQLRSLDVLFEYGILRTHQHLEDLKRSITRSISEAKPHVARVKPKRVRICVQVSLLQKQYYGSAEDAIFDAAVHDAREASACDVTDTDAFYEADLSSSSSSSSL